ncbi:hypothetical protein HDU76_012037, partial [Blyttiomyces sp. JEL0837]
IVGHVPTLSRSHSVDKLNTPTKKLKSDDFQDDAAMIKKTQDGIVKKIKGRMASNYQDGSR